MNTDLHLISQCYSELQSLAEKFDSDFEVSNKYPVELKFHYFQAATSSYIVICILRVNKTRQIERFFADAANCSMILQRWVTTDMDSSVYASGG